MSRADSGNDAKRVAAAIQKRAADPRVSCVLRAAAGSGKTRTLVDRIVRLCLAGARPQSIVAVTFTRKAAHEIKARLLEALRRLAAASPEQRQALLRELLDRPPTGAEVALAATLYDRVLEDLPGLPIGTIHSFCHRLLARFADELGLDPSFAVLEKTDLLWGEALARVEREAASDPQGRAELASLARDPTAVRARLTRLLNDRAALERWFERATGSTALGGTPKLRAEAQAALTADLRRALLSGSPLDDHAAPTFADLLPLLHEGARRVAEACGSEIPAIDGGKPTSALLSQLSALSEKTRELVDRLAASVEERERAAGFAALRDALLVKDERRGGWKLRDLKGSAGTRSEKASALAVAAHPLVQALALADTLALIRDNERLLRWGLRALDVYEDLKRRNRCLDFHDLESVARRLLNDGEQAPYVQYRLDARIDHLLVDEFQDTSVGQWQILQPLANEFLAGESARGGGRTLFFVGDVKQSIYRWRDAAPELFPWVERWLVERQGEAASLPTNFRSLPAIVQTVGRLFQSPPLSEALPLGESSGVAQLVARTGEGPGEVWVLPALVGEGGPEAVERAAAAATGIVTRARASKRVRDPRDGVERQVRWSDILLLCRDRRRIAVYEQALRAAGVPTVPAGRGALARSREVQDILQLLRWLTFPGDDVALATVLRSPLFRVSESSLQRALSGRPSHRTSSSATRLNVRRPFWTSLRRHGRELGTELARAVDLLERWRRHIGLASCHDLLRRVFADSDAPARFAAAGGEQARYNLMRLLDLALDLEREAVPTLRSLVDAIARAAETAGEEEATVPEEGDGRVRLMTVHAAKGLEAPIVLLVDAASPPRPAGRERLTLSRGGEFASRVYDAPRSLTADVHPAADADWPRDCASPDCPPLRAALAAAGEAARAEEADILYVALTRARDELYVLGSQPTRGRADDSPLSWLEDAATAAAGGEQDQLTGSDASVEARPGPAGLPARFASPPGVDAASLSAAATAAAAWPGVTIAEEPALWDPAPLRAWAVLVRPSQLARGENANDPEGDDDLRPDTHADAVAGNEPARRAAAARGEAIHLALRTLAEAADTAAARGAAGDSTVSGGARTTSACGELRPRCREAREEALAVTGNPALAWIFAATAGGARGYCEVPVIHRAGLAEEPDAGAQRRVYGIIDRLLIWPDRAAIIDYKSNRVSDSESLRRLCDLYRPQLVAYRDAVQALLPNLQGKVSAHILFTHPRDDAGRQGLLVDIE